MKEKIMRRGFLSGMAATALPWTGAAAEAEDHRRYFQSRLDAQGRRTLYIPQGVWPIDMALLPRNGSEIVCEGELVAAPDFYGQGATGGCVAIRHSQNIRWSGGVLNGNNVAVQAGFNGLAISAPFASRDGRTINVVVEGVTIRNCRSDSKAPVGAGGGKGFAIQFGVQDVLLRDIDILDCDIPFSLEGRKNNEGWVAGIDLLRVTARNCRRGVFLNYPKGRPEFLRVSGASVDVDSGKERSDCSHGLANIGLRPGQFFCH